MQGITREQAGMVQRQVVTHIICTWNNESKKQLNDERNCESAQMRNNDSTKQRKYETTKVRNNESAKQRKYVTTKERDYETKKVGN